MSQQQADSKKVSVNLYFNKQQPLSKNNLVFVSNIFRIANDSKFSAFLPLKSGPLWMKSKYFLKKEGKYIVLYHIAPFIYYLNKTMKSWTCGWF